MVLAELCLDLFLLAHAHVQDGMTDGGFGFERKIHSHLARYAFSASRQRDVFGHTAMSGAYHQLDRQLHCSDALVIGEWKAYKGLIPKNDLLRFKAATDDYWLESHWVGSLPVIRIFGGTGQISDSMRVYAAQNGIVLITPDRWPVPTLCNSELLWSAMEIPGPCNADLRTMGSLFSPLNLLLTARPDGSWRIPELAQAPHVRARLHVANVWSDRAWAFWDQLGSGRFDWLSERRLWRTDHVSSSATV